MKLIAGKVARHNSPDFGEIFVDLTIPGYKGTSELFRSSRQDMSVLNGGKLTVIELTVSFDRYTEKSKTIQEDDIPKPEKRATNRM